MGLPQKVAIIGAGPTGLSTAWRLARDNPRLEIHIFDRAAQPGGLHQSFQRLGHTFDTGLFLYSRGPGPMSLPGLFPTLFAPVANLRNGVLFHGRCHAFPLPARAILGVMPIGRRLLFLPHFLISRIVFRASLRRSGSLEDWLRSRLGGWAYEYSGLNQYMVKLLGMTADEVDLAFAEKRLQGLNDELSWRALFHRLFRPVRKALAPGAPHKPTGGQSTGKLYPARGGAGGITRHMADALAEQGVKFHLSCTVGEILRDGDCYTLNFGQGKLSVTQVVSTMPVQSLARICGLGTGEERFVLRRLLMIYLVVARPRVLGDDSILYSFEPHHLWKRATNYSALRPVPASVAESALGIEDTLPETATPLDIENYVENAIASLTDEYALFRRNEIRLVETKILSGAYPVFRVGYREDLARLQAKIVETGILSAGVGGAFDNIDSHDCIEQGFLAAEQILRRIGHQPPVTETVAAQ
jgi:protoporphyrinogen oxidase